MYRLIVLFFISVSAYSQTDSIFHSPNMKFKYTGKCQNNIKIGVWKEINTNDSTIYRTFEMINDTTFKVIYLFNDTLLSSYSYGYFENNNVILNGDYFFEDKRKNITEEGSFFKNEKIGLWYTFENKQLLKIENYSLNKLIVYFFHDGQLEEVSEFLNKNSYEVRDGVYMLYDKDHTLKELGRFQNNSMVGEWSYFNNGQVVSHGSFKPDYLRYKVENDTLKIVNNENIEARKIYSSKLIQQFIQKNKDNGTQILNIKNGWWYYYENNRLIKREFYKNGVLIKSK